MSKFDFSRHAYSVLNSAVITAVAVPFNPEIPWMAWIGAFLIIFFATELACKFIWTEKEHGENKKAYTLLCCAGVALLVLLLLLFMISS